MTIKLNKISSALQKNRSANRNKSALYSSALVAMLAMPAYAAEEASQTKNNDEIEVIQVTGILGSMKAASILKRTDSRIVDAIVAEDIGKLPDNNIAEALQRITGV